MKTLRAVALALACGFLLGAVLRVEAQDSTTILASFLKNLRASHFIIGPGTAPVLSSCGDGALAAGSTDTSGRVDGTTQTACTLTFGGTFGTNSADCVINNITANRGNITALSNTAFTVSTLTAGDDFTYLCAGR